MQQSGSFYRDYAGRLPLQKLKSKAGKNLSLGHERPNETDSLGAIKSQETLANVSRLGRERVLALNFITHNSAPQVASLKGIRVFVLGGFIWPLELSGMLRGDQEQPNFAGLHFTWVLSKGQKLVQNSTSN